MSDTTSDSTAGRVTHAFAVAGAPVSANRLWCVGRGRAYTPAPASAWKRRVFEAAMALEFMPIEGDVRLKIVYHHQHPKRRLDLDNVIKGVLDGLQAFFNDKQVVWLSAERVFSPGDPRVEVRIEAGE